MATRIIIRGLVASVLLLHVVPTAVAEDTRYIYGTSIDGITKQLAVDRNPALYTGNFGDCLRGQSGFNITKFDAAVSLIPNQRVPFIDYRFQKQKTKKKYFKPFEGPASGMSES